MKNLDEAVEIDDLCEGLGVVIRALNTRDAMSGEVFLLNAIRKELQGIAERIVCDPPGNSVDISLAADTSTRFSAAR